MASIGINCLPGVDFDDYVAGEVLSVNRRRVEDSWILDTGSTFHMCPHKKLFVDYRRMSGTVHLGDSRSSSVDGIESVKLRMGNRVIRTFRCWHVPGMKRSLLSMSTLDSKGYRYHARRGVLTVCRGSSTAIKGDLVRGQYLLRGSAVSGEATAVGAESCDHHLVLEWHRHLGHRSETEMRDWDGGPLRASSLDGS